MIHEREIFGRTRSDIEISRSEFSLKSAEKLFL